MGRRKLKKGGAPPGLEAIFKAKAKANESSLSYEEQEDIIAAEERAILEHQTRKAEEVARSEEYEKLLENARKNTRPLLSDNMGTIRRTTGRVSGLPSVYLGEPTRKTRATTVRRRTALPPPESARLQDIEEVEGGALASAYNRLTVKELKAAIQANPVAKHYLKESSVAQPRKAHLVVALEYAESVKPKPKPLLRQRK